MLQRLLMIGILMTVACKKKDATPAAEGSGSAAVGSAMTAPAPTPTPPPTVGSGSAPAPTTTPAGGIASADDYNKKNDALQAKLVDIVKEPDCGKMGTAMQAAFDANKDDILAVAAYEKAHPDAKAAWDKAHKDEMEKSMAPLAKCQNDPAVKAALAKMPD